jgi:uncharacterized DUF497 family protein
LDDSPRGFTWDGRKARDNALKHGVSFEVATSVFDDAAGLVETDPVHSQHEVRERMIGRSRTGAVLVVVFTARADTIRIISARLARRSERIRYEAEARRRGY